ncbi:MAG: flotillin-like protein FloA [Clostridia bacterium]
MITNKLLLALSGGAIAGIVVASVVLVLFVLLIIFVPIRLWTRALVSGAHVSMFRLLGMKMRKVNVRAIVDTYISATKAGLKISIDELETHVLAGGDVTRVVKALIAAHSAGIDITLQTAKAIDLAGRDVYAAIKVSVVPKVIETPLISAIAKDGIELKVKAKVTVKSNMRRQIGGADEETIIARVGEGIVTTVGSAENHGIVLENPDLISSTVLNKGLDTSTAYEILSIDIADIDVGRNVGAQLKIDSAEADKRIAQAKAEERRSMAFALEQEMKAKMVEMQSALIEKQGEIPKAIAQALMKGNLGLMDYYNMENLQADTAMRSGLTSGKDDKKSTRRGGGYGGYES